MQGEGFAVPRCFKRLSCTQADLPLRGLRYVHATAGQRAADAVHDEAASGIAGMEIADSCRYLHAFPRQGGAFEFKTIRPDITRVADLLGQSAFCKLVHDVLRAVPPDVEGRDIDAKTPETVRASVGVRGCKNFKISVVDESLKKKNIQ